MVRISHVHEVPEWCALVAVLDRIECLCDYLAATADISRCGVAGLPAACCLPFCGGWHRRVALLCETARVKLHSCSGLGNNIDIGRQGMCTLGV